MLACRVARKAVFRYTKHYRGYRIMVIPQLSKLKPGVRFSLPAHQKQIAPQDFMGELRTKEGQARYEEYKAAGGLAGGCKLCEAPPLKVFKYWALVKNNFPYDKIAEVHDMLIPKRHVTEEELSQEEWHEFQQIKDEYIHKEYEFMIEATHRKKSIPAHFHLHLLVAKS